jgi:hypothetical protein
MELFSTKILILIFTTYTTQDYASFSVFIVFIMQFFLASFYIIVIASQFSSEHGALFVDFSMAPYFCFSGRFISQ